MPSKNKPFEAQSTRRCFGLVLKLFLFGRNGLEASDSQGNSCPSLCYPPSVSSRANPLRLLASISPRRAVSFMRSAWLILLVLLFGPLASSQQYPFLHVPGSPEGISEMFQDSRGLLWLATGEELVAFDGAHFYSMRDSGYPKTEAMGLAEDADGGIWAATRSGVYRYSQGRVAQILSGVSLSVVRVSPTVMLAGVFPAGKNFGMDPQFPPVDLFRIRKTNQNWKAERLSNWQASGFLTVDPSGSTIYPCSDGWCEIPAKLVEDWHPGADSAPIIHGFKSGSERILRDPSGCVWFRSASGAGFQSASDSPVTLFAESGTLDSTVKMGLLQDQSIYIIGGGKLIFGRPGNFRVIRSTNGLPSPQSVLGTRDGSVWVGTPNGLYRVAQSFRLEFWTSRDGLEYPLSELHLGNKVFAASGQGIRVLSPERENWQRVGDPVNLGLVLNLAPGPSQSILAGRFDGVTQIATDGRILADSVRDSSKYSATKILSTAPNQFWLSGVGVRPLTLKPGKVEIGENQIPTAPDFLSLDLKYQPQTDSLWACDPIGLLSRKNGVWRKFTTQDGLLNNICISVAALPDGDVWFGYGSKPTLAHLHFDSGEKIKLDHFTDGGFVGTAAVQFLDVDRRGWLWRGAPDGVYVADPADAASGLWFRLAAEEGLPEVSGNQQSFYNDPDGSVWFGVQNSIVHFNPKPDFVQNSAAPQIFLSGFSWSPNKSALAQSLSALPHGTPITANIGSIYFDHRNELRLRYRLLPGQTQWKDANSFDLAIGKLSWGSHTLQVEGRIGFGPWSGPISETFSVAKPLWLTWPALLGFAVVGLVSGAAGKTWHKNRLERTRKVLPELAPWRIATLLPEVQEYTGSLLDSRFEVRELIARGGFANVMDGFDRHQKVRCAIKFFRGEVGKNEWIMRHFQHEVAVLQQVQHQNIVPIIAHGSTPSGVPYLVMEYVEGKSLRELMPSGPIAPARAARFLNQLASALAAIHKKEICHRDVKPENLMIRNLDTPSEELILIDFSISLVKDANETLHGISRAAGSFDYMAPEQAIGYAQPSTDIYSVSKVLIEVLTGKRLATLLPGASMDLPARIRELFQTLPIHFSQTSIDFISASLEFDPSHRPQEILAFAAPIVADLESQPAIR